MEDIMKKLKLLLAAFMVFGLVGCGGDSSIDWPTSGLATKIPKPEKGNGEIVYNDEDMFNANITDISKEDYSNYVDLLKKDGYDKDFDDKGFMLTTYNDEGYEIMLFFNEDDGEYSINANAPKATGKLEWPKVGLATLIPKIDSEKGNVDIDSESQLLIYVGDMDADKYNDYVQKCMEKGFTKDYDKTEKLFTAHDKNDNSLRISLEGANTVCITMYAADESNETTATDNGDDNSGIRDSFKKTMDDYEKFFDEYIDFMETYSSSSDKDSLMSDYNDYMKAFSDTMESMNSMDQSELNDEEIAYYNEVNGRITKKLLEADVYSVQ